LKFAATITVPAPIARTAVPAGAAQSSPAWTIWSSGLPKQLLHPGAYGLTMP
jgi:hypothetical protein